MAGTTITTISALGLTMSSAGPPFVSIAITGGVQPAVGPAIYGSAGYWSLFNQGEVIGGAGGIGIYVASGTASLANEGYIGGQSGIEGSIILQNTGLIAGRTGAGIAGAGSIINRGTILGGLTSQQGDNSAIGIAFSGGLLTNGVIGLVRGEFEGVNFSGAGSIANLGTIEGLDGTGVMLAAGSDLINGSKADSGALIYGKFGGVSLAGAGTVVNYGRIATPAGTGPLNGSGIALAGAGLVLNDGQISGFYGIDAGAGTVENTGLISGGAALQIGIPFAGYVYFAGAGVALEGGTLQNAGTVQGGNIPAFPFSHAGTAGAGVTLNNGLVVNTGSIAGGMAVGFMLTAGSGVLAITGTLENAGQISGGDAYNGGTGLTVLANAYAQNTGTIQGGFGAFGGAGVLLQGGTLQNAGSVAGGDGTSWNWAPGLAAGVDIYTGLLVNTGFITGGAEQHIGVNLGAGTLQNAGTISGATGVLAQSGYTDNTGLIQGADVGVDIGAGTLVNSGTITGHYAVYMALAAQHLVADPGAEFLGNVVAKGNDVTLEMALGTGPLGTGTLDMGTSFSGFASIVLDQDGNWDLGGGLAQLAGGEIITGFTQGDTLELEGFTASSAFYVPGTGLVLSDGTAEATLDITGNFAANDFIASANAAGTNIAICYARGTRIMTIHGEFPIETLKIGDVLPAYFAGTQTIKWIGRQNFTVAELKGDRTRIPVCIAAGALGDNLPQHALIVSPGHSLLVEGTLLLAKFMVNGITITQPEPVADVEYYQLEFASHDCLMAEGAWAESFADGPGLRGNFHNVAEFYHLYPDYITPETISLCAPRPEYGPILAVALSPISARVAKHQPGALRGFIDIIEGQRVEGWAQDVAWPELPQLLEFSAGEIVVGQALACLYRRDLAEAGIGTGRAHFAFTAEVEFPRTSLRVRRVADGAEIGVAAHVI